ncbi:hypothetical protein XBFM1_2330050 [Xenorhabdus bovienii str. feltiae Moldova]|uniref:Uncharacterized protein n=1 Tax=Xenorhabdus bovienii str. feltiae Moldova TaxID=1398200 RepID=A0A077NI71_XENBV|nr:hypothetical protein XBFM1_2330050 [Xenorhabdus bovienii str. feltiae Moldova]
MESFFHEFSPIKKAALATLDVKNLLGAGYIQVDSVLSKRCYKPSSE